MQNRKFKKLSTFIAATMLSVVTIGTTAFAIPVVIKVAAIIALIPTMDPIDRSMFPVIST